MNAHRTQVVLFDLGGVLFHIGHVGAFGEMIGETDDGEVLRRWVTCPWVQRYDRGQCSRQDFAVGIVEHHGIALTPDKFLNHFTTWVPGPQDGAADLLRETKASGMRTACLSNTNEAHWSADNGLAAFVEQFDHRFLSFEIGHVKPDLSSFTHVAAELGCYAGEVLFLDDVQVNVDTACSLGFDAMLAKGIAMARSILHKRAII